MHFCATSLLAAANPKHTIDSVLGVPNLFVYNAKD